jgi:hypothetical protein
MRGGRGVWAGAGFGAFVVLLVASTALASSWNVPVGWTNGTVLCRFAASTPDVGVSALSVPESGLTAGLAGLSEAQSNGAVIATASLAGSSWTATNLSTEDAYDQEFSTSAPIEAVPSAAGPIGSVNLSVQFVLPAYNGSPDGAATQVTVILSESGWSWQGSGDNLVLTVAASPSPGATEHLAASTATGWLLSSLANATGATREQLGTNSTGLVTYPDGSETIIPANTSVALASPESATVSVVFSAAAGDFSSLAFTATVGIVLPATIAGIPLPEILAAAGAATVVSLLVAVGARRLRRRPSRLIYTEDEP